MYDASARAEPAAPPSVRRAIWPAWLEWDRIGAAVIAAVLLVLAIGLPLWRMTLLAPQYPGGLHMTAYGNRFAGDVREINILNHYIGMKPIEAGDVPELNVFRPGMALLIVALLVLAVAPLPHWLKVAQSVAIWLLPLGIIADLQWWLYRYGHGMDPLAPLRLDPFTPRVFGTTKVMNFHNEAAFAAGFWLIVAAVAVISLGPSLLRALWELPAALRAGAAGAALLLLLLPVDTARMQAAATPETRIAALIAAAPPGATVRVPPGVYHEQVVIDKPLALDGGGHATIDGGGAGDVVVVRADNVTLRGFTIRNSGTAISREPAGVRLLGHATTLTSNRIEQVYFGIMVQGGGHHEIGFNTIRPGTGTPLEWRGHAISLWNTEHNVIRRNQISDAKDGMFISFSHQNFIHGNHVSGSRFGIHYMNAHNNRFTENVFTQNHTGALVMNSKGLFLKGNHFTKNNQGATAHGLLLKNVDDLWAEDNRITANGTGISLDDTPSTPGASVIFHRNLIGLNQVGLSLTTTTAVTFYENSMVDNVRQVSGRGGGLIAATLARHDGGVPAAPAAVGRTDATRADAASHAGHPPVAAGASAHNRWQADGRGNYWSDYNGYDANGDGAGDLPYRAGSAFESLRDRNPLLDLFRYTPAHQAIDAAARLAPLVRPEVLIEDTAPLMSPPTPLPVAGGSGGLLMVSAALLLTAALPVWLLWRQPSRAAARRRGAQFGRQPERAGRPVATTPPARRSSLSFRRSVAVAVTRTPGLNVLAQVWAALPRTARGASPIKPDAAPAIGAARSPGSSRSFTGERPAGGGSHGLNEGMGGRSDD